jgi:acetyl-CoA carboxylase carboxyltransferase component
MKILLPLILILSAISVFGQSRETYDRELDAKHAAARGSVDAIVPPENLRDSLLVALQTCLNTTTPHIGAFVLPNVT